jgi:hypothetical protein
MIYYTIYVKDLNNSVGYIDVALEDDQLLRDFEQYLDIGVRPHRSYPLAPTVGAQNAGGLFTIDFTSISAITTIFADKNAAARSRSYNTDSKKKHDTSSHSRHTTR